MKIAHICPFFKPVICGVGNVVYELARRQASQGNEVYVLTSDYGKGNRIKVKYELLEGVKVKRHRYWFKLGEFATFWPSVFSTLMKIKPDVVHTHNFGHPHVLLGGIAARITSAKHIHSTHYPWTASRARWKSALFSAYYRIYAAVFNKLTDTTLILTEQEKPFLAKYGIKSKVEILPNGVNSKFFNLSNKPSNKKRVLFLGRMSSSKGVDILAKAEVQISAERKNVEFIFAGPDEGLTELVREICKDYKNIKILGEVSEDKKIDLIRSADIFVLPSRREGLPLVLLEAMAAGKAIVASAVDGILVVAKDRKNCLLFERENVQQLKETIEILLGNQKLAKELAKNAKLCAKNYEWTLIERKLREIYGNPEL